MDSSSGFPCKPSSHQSANQSPGPSFGLMKPHSTHLHSFCWRRENFQSFGAKSINSSNARWVGSNIHLYGPAVTAREVGIVRKGLLATMSASTSMPTRAAILDDVGSSEFPHVPQCRICCFSSMVHDRPAAPQCLKVFFLMLEPAKKRRDPVNCFHHLISNYR